MKTLASPGSRREILDRLSALTPDSRRRWGRMTAHQAVVHLSDSYRCGMGEKSASPKLRPGRSLMKFGALYVFSRWPKGVPTRPEMDQEAGGTAPVDFARDREDLQQVIDRFSRNPRDFSIAQHPIFGAMTERDWLRWGYLHAHHHLRQFSC